MAEFIVSSGSPIYASLLEYAAHIPLDAKSIVDTSIELYKRKNGYEGEWVYALDTNKFYYCKEADDISSN